MLKEIQVISDPPEGLPALYTIYTNNYFKGLKTLAWRSPIIFQALIQTFKLYKGAPILDAGCGTGDLVKYFNDHGFRAKGIEGSASALPFLADPNIDILDLRLCLKKKIKLSLFSLVFSFSVAEHIEKDYADIYLDNLCRASHRVLLTAAAPGDPKRYRHLNCQEKEWWIEKMNQRNYKRYPDLEEQFRAILLQQSGTPEIEIYAKNVMIFKAIQFTGRT